MFDASYPGHLIRRFNGWPIRESNMALLSGRKYSWIVIIWAIIGLVVAWERSYLTLFLVKIVFSALLAIFLWPLVLLGINLHIH
jgi:Na+/pantothenate symporter